MFPLEQLVSYAKKQVILNTYEDEELIGKDGYCFERIVVKEHRVMIYGADHSVLVEIRTHQYPRFEQLDDFPHHYLFSDELRKIELYFVS